MDQASDYLTVMQLGVAINLVAGAYTSARKDFEHRVAQEIDDYRETMATLIPGTPDRQIREGLEKERNLSHRELGRYLHDISNRFDRRSFKYGRFDRSVEASLTLIGITCAVGLVLASMWPDFTITKPWGFSLSLVVIAPPLAAFLKTLLELRTHNFYYRRRMNDSRAELERGRNEERSRSEARAGEIHRAINQVRARIRSSAMGRAGERDY